MVVGSLLHDRCSVTDNRTECRYFGTFAVLTNESVLLAQESLAEFAMAAALHFNKQIPRCQDNRRNRKWDKFVMDTLDGKTIGFL